MWCTVLVLALVATADPIRIGVSAVLSSRPRAAGPLLAFWLGGMAISVVLAAGVLFGLRDVAVTAMHRVQLAAATTTAAHIQIMLGSLALLVAVAVVGLSSRRRTRPGLGAPGPSPSAFARMSTRANHALETRPLGVAFALGMGMLVDFRFLAALTAILASDAAMRVQVGAAGVYTLIALAFVELPLISQFAAPARTDRVMAAVNQWAKARRQQVSAAVIALLGAFLMSRGLGHA
ncbi:GAP family protein [Mycobacterium vicinigordonae]|uniref:GAP family protein n=1 Tax=Mycobacterium vicinigordonae TaxID=1719132 RepID=A0A7D6DWG3_9MYCO|nr:GAP family protein [Mycobacterium vicinigordonae]QLL05789.1 GAP family protein [Mycobacterium vicinigordonae]